MGTSGTYGGPSSLEPSHLDGGNEADDGSQSEDPGSDENPSTDEESADPKSGENQDPETPPSKDAQDLLKPSLPSIRSNFTRYTNSGGIHHLGKAVRGYVASSGGSGGAVRRMPSSTTLVSNLARFANRVVTEGVEQALEEFDLQSLADRPVAEILEALVDKIGPEGGTIDEAVARDAMIETIADFVSEDLDDFNQLTQEQLGELIVQVIARSITTKVINEIGTNSLYGSASDADFQQAESTLEDYTLGAVQDAFQQEFSLGEAISSQQVDHKVKEIFSNTLEILQATLEDE